MAASESKDEVFVITEYDKNFKLNNWVKPRLWKRNDVQFAILTTHIIQLYFMKYYNYLIGEQVKLLNILE